MVVVVVVVVVLLPFSISEVSEIASSDAMFDMKLAVKLPSSQSDGAFSEVVSSIDISDAALCKEESSTHDSHRSGSSDGCCKLQYMMLAVRTRIIF